MSSIIALNKPFGVISQFSEHEKHPTLKNYVDLPGFYPAGRLDTDSEGLLLLTNDGKLQAKIADPKFKQAKTYWAQVEGIVTDEAISLLQKGIALKEFTTAPAKASVIPEPAKLWQRDPPIRERKSIPTSWISLTIKEGKNRQVRRMCAHVGFPCLRLVRVQIGNINVFDIQLPLGQWQYISATDVLK
ncbi:rRNA large subunit pseudouridine synthase E [Zophobihabitans entericus]|uniref:Pseudouridine synthase n=1 Tax=Zophobihabitans entericus TaxID=1635327 RepID=A0A6G9IAD5_9GAMM|nr:rRNA large subunit pseudouridine synthase E [Zophobihabitans entericus]QIQ20684.1 rRNA large subunit pseudouridine synthase E [Zophobihabitans entericus]